MSGLPAENEPSTRPTNTTLESKEKTATSCMASIRTGLQSPLLARRGNPKDSDIHSEFVRPRPLPNRSARGNSNDCSNSVCPARIHKPSSSSGATEGYRLGSGSFGALNYFGSTRTNDPRHCTARGGAASRRMNPNHNVDHSRWVEATPPLITSRHEFRFQEPFEPPNNDDVRGRW